MIPTPPHPNVARFKVPPSIAILLLAAGPSSRLGTPKQLILYKGRTLLRHAAENAVASKAHSTYVVLGAEADKMKPELSGLSVHLIENAHWSEGIASSIRAGVEALSPSTDAVIITVCDQPMVSSRLLDTIIVTFLTSNKSIVACEYSNTLGVPALFAQKYTDELLSLHGERGAKQIILRRRNDTASVPFSEGAFDIDTPEDLAKLK